VTFYNSGGTVNVIAHILGYLNCAGPLAAAGDSFGAESQQ
jgi:hypothetical protein